MAIPIINLGEGMNEEPVLFEVPDEMTRMELIEKFRQGLVEPIIHASFFDVDIEKEKDIDPLNHDEQSFGDYLKLHEKTRDMGIKLYLMEKDIFNEMNGNDSDGDGDDSSMAIPVINLGEGMNNEPVLFEIPDEMTCGELKERFQQSLQDPVVFATYLDTDGEGEKNMEFMNHNGYAFGDYLRSYAKTRGMIVKVCLTEFATYLEENAPPSDDDDDDSTTTSEESDDEDPDNANSGDEQERHDRMDKPDGSSGYGSSSAMPSAVLPSAQTEPDYSDDALKLLLNDADTVEKLKVVKEMAKKRVIYYKEIYDAVTKDIKDKEKDEKKRLKKEADKVKRAEDRRAANEEKQRPITLNITISGVTRPLQVVPTITVAMLRDLIVSTFLPTLKKKDGKKGKIMKGETDICENPRKACLFLNDGDVLSFIPRGEGGGKRAKPMPFDIHDEEFPCANEDKKLWDNVFMLVVRFNEAKEMTKEDILKGIKSSELTNIADELVKDKSRMPEKLMAVSNYIDTVQSVVKVEKMAKYATDKMKKMVGRTLYDMGKTTGSGKFEIGIVAGIMKGFASSTGGTDDKNIMGV